MNNAEAERTQLLAVIEEYCDPETPMLHDGGLECSEATEVFLSTGISIVTTIRDAGPSTISAQIAVALVVGWKLGRRNR